MLKQFFDLHVRWLAETAENCPPNTEIAAMFTYADADLHCTYTQLPDEPPKRLVRRMTRVLQARKAAYYAVVHPSWAFQFPDESYESTLSQHGPEHPDLIPYRHEGYTVTAGSKEGTLVAFFSVARGPDGRIAMLHRQPNIEAVTGPLIDLLTTRH